MAYEMSYKENDTYILIGSSGEKYSDGKILYECECKLCGEVHLRTLPQFNNQARDRKNCPQYRNHNWQGRSRDDQRLYTMYGIMVEDYETMRSEQKGCCAICGKHESKCTKRLHIDHCHATGKVRGLLCGSCNTAIGLLGDDIERLKYAIRYLQK